MSTQEHLVPSSISELQARLAEVTKAISERRVEEVKVLADGYAKKLQMNGFSIAEGIEALKPYLPRKAEAKEPKYRNPSNASETWIGLGKQPAWFKQALAAGTSKDVMLI